MWFFNPAPNKPYMFHYLGKRTFIVEESSNSKLKTGDTFACSLLVLGEPLLLTTLYKTEDHPLPLSSATKVVLPYWNTSSDRLSRLDVYFFFKTTAERAGRYNCSHSFPYDSYSASN